MSDDDQSGLDPVRHALGRLTERIKARRLFLPESPDILRTLRHQAELTSRGLDALGAWAHGRPDQGEEIKRIYAQTTEVRRQQHRQLRISFTTPLDAEDLYELSERLDVVLANARDTVREAEVTRIGPDEAIVGMTEVILAAFGDVTSAYSHLVEDPEKATHEADSALDRLHDLEHIYRHAMSDLLADEDLRQVIGRRDIYRGCLHIGDATRRVAERVWYAVIKQA